MNAALDAYCLVDARLRIVTATPRFAELLGQPAATLTGQRLLDFVAPDRRAEAARMLAERRGVEHTLELCGEDGSLLRGRMVTAPSDAPEFALSVVALERIAPPTEAVAMRVMVALEAINDGVMVLDGDGSIAWLNAAAARLVGSAAPDVVGQPLAHVYRLIDEATRARVPSAVQEVLRSGEASRSARRVLAPWDGRERPIIEEASVVKDARGNTIEAVLVFRDRSAEQRAETLAVRSQAELRRLMEGLADGCTLISAEGLIIYANPALASFLGQAGAGELTGRDISELLGNEDRERFAALVRSPAEAHDARAQEWRFIRRDGSTITLEGLPGQLIEFDGRLAVIWVLRDVSERKRLQTQLMQADRLVSIGTLAAGVAHEINNPLAYVLANLEFAMRELGESAEALTPENVAEMRQALAEAREGAERVRHIVRDLKTFSRADEKVREPVDLRRVIEAAINMAFNEIRHRARLVKEYGDTPPVEGNEARLGQVFLNLLINAAQAVPDGGADKHVIRVATRADGDRAVVEVHDTGVGIAPEVLERIFDPFFTTKPVGVGTGLGLSICRDIVNALGGSLAAESRPGAGSTFRVTLPLARSVAAASGPMSASGTAGRRGRLLVIDDEPGVLLCIRRALEEHEVVTEDSARRAFARLVAGERFDLVLCDLMMPDMNGMDFYAEAAARTPEYLGRLVLLTGGAFTPKAREFLDRVHVPRVEKPFDSANLRSLVRSLLE